MILAIFYLLAVIALLGFLPMYLLYGIYAAVMNFKRAKDAGKLSKAGLFMGYPWFIFDMILDIYCNAFPMSLLLLELPREFTVSSRMTRLSQVGGWRGDVARWFCEDLLDGLDPSGKHCKE